MKTVLVTGSSGLIGSEVVKYYCSQGCRVYGVDNNQREVFFGPEGSTRVNQSYLTSKFPLFTHIEEDIRNRESILRIYADLRPTAVVHTAAQPSHDRAASIPFDDFDTNAVGTFNLIEAHRRYCPEAPFVHMSTNKVYGDRPNQLEIVEDEFRYRLIGDYAAGISESMSIDQSKHSIFGASKTAADIVVQEYGRYFGIPTCCLRGGCLTGEAHSAVKLHGFLNYLVKCNISGSCYTILGYKGKQVRDNIHARDVVAFIASFIDSPRSGEVYNLGGGISNSISILESFKVVERITGKPMIYAYSDEARIGDHVCYYSDLAKCRSHFPGWDITVPVEKIIEDIAVSLLSK